MIKLFNTLGIYNDKAMHFLSGALLCAVIGVCDIRYGVVASIVAGALKELYDYLNQDRHTVDFLDFVYTSAGGLVVFVVRILIHTYLGV